MAYCIAAALKAGAVTLVEGGHRNQTHASRPCLRREGGALASDQGAELLKMSIAASSVVFLDISHRSMSINAAAAGAFAPLLRSVYFGSRGQNGTRRRLSSRSAIH